MDMAACRWGTPLGLASNHRLFDPADFIGSLPSLYAADDDPALYRPSAAIDAASDEIYAADVRLFCFSGASRLDPLLVYEQHFGLGAAIFYQNPTTSRLPER